MVTQIISRLRKTFKVDLPLRSLFEASTIAALAGLIEESLIEKLEAFSEESAASFLENPRKKSADVNGGSDE